ncbi:MAG: type II secretion system F family protein [Ilumatobacteraceae bacterium]
MSALAGLLVAAAVALAVAAHRPAPSRPVSGSTVTPSVPVGGCIAAFELAASEVRGGASVPASIAISLRRHPHVLPELAVALGRGLTLDRALDELPDQMSREERWFAHSLRLCHATGGAAAEVLDRAVAVARERRAWAAERRAQASQARLSARLLTVLPLVFAGWGVVSSAQVRSAYATSPIVVACTLVGLVLNGVGWWWMRRLVAGEPT